MEFTKGVISSVLSSTIIYPIDVIKTNYQIKPQNIFLLTEKIIKNRTLYAGLSSHLTTYPIFWGVFFYTKQINIYDNNFINSFICGGIASFSSNPFFVLKTRQQINKENYKQMISNIYKNEGIRGFYKGLNSTLINNLKLGLQFPLYDYFKEKTESILLSGFLSKTISSTLFYPLDLIRIHQRNSVKNISIKSLIKKIGYTNLYKGVLMYNAVSIPNFMLLMLFKEIL